MSDPLPVTVVGGFLGAGKTTLINHALRNAAGRRLAILVNEFGALPIDEDLIEAQGDDLISIAGGCICCAFGDNLAAAMVKLAALEPRPDHVVIEASGVAIPGSISASLSLLADYQPAATVVLVDAETVRQQAKDTYLGDTILRQISDADLLIETKTDVLTEREKAAVSNWLAQVAPDTRILPISFGQIPLDVLLGPSVRSQTGASGPHADRLFDSVVLEDPGGIDVRRLSEALATFGLLRAKGTLRDMSGKRLGIQVVGRRAQTHPAPEGASLGLVCIGRAGELDKNALAALVANTR